MPFFKRANESVPRPRSVGVECNSERWDQQVSNDLAECLCHPVNILRYPLVSADQTHLLQHKFTTDSEFNLDITALTAAVLPGCTLMVRRDSVVNLGKFQSQWWTTPSDFEALHQMEYTEYTEAGRHYTCPNCALAPKGKVHHTPLIEHRRVLISVS